MTGSFDTRMVIGWPQFGIGRIRCYTSQDDWYTIWLLCLTRHMAIGIHLSWPSRRNSDGADAIE